MHLLSHKPKKDTPLVPIVSIFAVPGIRKSRGKRFNAAGEYIGPCGPPKPVPEPSIRKLIQEAYAAAALLPAPQEGGGFDLNCFRPLPGKILVTRPPMIREDGGIALPEDQWRHQPWYIVIKVGDRVAACAVGDRVIFQAKHKPKPVKLGGGGFYIGRAAVIVGLAETI